MARTPANDTGGMVEKRGHALWLSHALMILGILVVFFPIWLAFVASTVTQPEIVSPPMPVLPGPHFWENYSRALFAGVNVPVATMMRSGPAIKSSSHAPEPDLVSPTWTISLHSLLISETMFVHVGNGGSV